MKNAQKLVACMAVTFALCLPTGISASAGENPQAEADEISVQISQVAPNNTDSARVELHTTNEGTFEANNSDLAIQIPANNTGSVNLTNPEQPQQPLSIALPTDGGDKPAVMAHDGTITYQDALNDTDVAVQAFEEGVRVHTVLQGPESPTEFVYEVALPTGGQLKTVAGVGLLVLDDAGTPVGGFGQPWAKDDHGRDLPTRYEIRGNQVVQIVDHRAADTAYPVVVDPWLWRDLIAGASWTHGPNGWTLKVTPTSWARAWAGHYEVGVAGWNELYAKYGNRGLNTNLQGMRNQYICHQQFAALKSTWNLDEWRPNVGYTATVNALCNP